MKLREWLMEMDPEELGWLILSVAGFVLAVGIAISIASCGISGCTIGQ